MRYCLLTVLIFLGACSHPQQIIGKGGIFSQSGARDCTYEQYTSHSDLSSEACPNHVVGDYDETYTAVPKPGWDFEGWTGCDSPTDQCSFNIDAATVQQFWGQTAPPLVANFSQYYTFERIGYKVVDAEFSRTRDLLVSLAQDGDIYTYDTVTRTTNRIELDRPGVALSVSPDGLSAVVGHSGLVTHVDLVRGTVLDTFPITLEAHDVLLAGNGYAYVTARWDRRMVSINLETGEVFTLDNVFQIKELMPMILHPSGEYFYATQTNSSDTKGWKYDIRTGAADFQYKSASGAEFGMCRKMWPSNDGLRIFSACGHVFRASEVQEQDMTYNGTLENTGPLTNPNVGPGLISLSQRGDEIVHLVAGQPDRVYTHQYNDLSFIRERLLPEVQVGEQHFQAEGKFVFHTSSGSHIVLAAIDEASGLELNEGIIHVLPDSSPTNTAPWAITPESRFVALGAPADLDGSASFDPEGASLTYTWQLEEAPAGSAAYVVSPGDPVTSFIPDAKGHYLLSLVVNDGVLDSLPAHLQLQVDDPGDASVVPLDFHVVDSDYSESLNSIVMVSTAPNRLIQYDLSSESFSEIPLPAVGNSVSVAPDGLLAAVGHNDSEQVSLVDLQNNLLLATYAAVDGMDHLVLANNGHVYLFPGASSWHRINTLDLLSGIITEHTGLSVYGSTQTALHPAGDFIYGANRGLSPSDLESYDISGGNAAYVDDSPYHGVYPVCGNIWVSEAGDQLFTACGRIFNSRPGQSDDMTYSGLMELQGRILSVSHRENEVAMLFEEPHFNDPDLRDRIGLFEFDTRRHIRDIILPSFDVGGALYSARGRHLFHNAAGDAVVVVMQADDSSGLLYDYALYIRKL